jgi:hypothetical protein
MPPTGDLTKAVLKIEDGEEIRCLFNPKEYSIVKTNQWTYKPVTGSGLPTAQFGGGQGRKLSLDLLFDATDEENGDVRLLTDKLFAAMEPSKQHATGGNTARPPMIEFRWGMTSTFNAVCDSLSVQFTMFRSDGVPIRAQAKVDLTQVQSATGGKGGGKGGSARQPGQTPGQNPTTHGIAGVHSHVVRDGDTLPSIAFAAYGDATLWRTVARANGIDDPMRLRRGAVLSIPTLTEL